jgi:hypothetical protein
MINAQNNSHNRFYEIHFRGTMDERYTRWFEGVNISVLPAGETLLSGNIPDQAALFGILNRLRDLNLELLEVRSNDIK